MKRIIAFLNILSVLFLFCACDGRDNHTQETTQSESLQTTLPAQAEVQGNTIKIGVLEPISGDDRYAGAQELFGVQYANSAENKITRGEDIYQIELVYADTACDAQTTLQAAQSLVKQGVSAVLGMCAVPSDSEAYKLFKDEGIPVINISSSPKRIGGFDGVFYLCADVHTQAQSLVQYAYHNLGLGKIYVLSQSGSEYSSALSLFFCESFESLGGTVLRGYFEKDESDFSAFFAEAQAGGCDALLSACGEKYAARIAQSARENGVTIKLLGTDRWYSNITAEAARGSSLSVYCSAFTTVHTSSEVYSKMSNWMIKDSERAQKNGSSKMTQRSLLGYDGYFVLLQALKNAESLSRQDITSAIFTVNYEGEGGLYRFDKTGANPSAEIIFKRFSTNYGTWYDA